MGSPTWKPSGISGAGFCRLDVSIFSTHSLCKRLTEQTSRNACFSICWRLCSLSVSCTQGLHADSRFTVGPPPKLHTHTVHIINCIHKYMNKLFPGPKDAYSTDSTKFHPQLSEISCSINNTKTERDKHTHTHAHPFNGPFPGLPRWASLRKVKPIWILLKQETMSGSNISWAICKSAPRSRQITTPATHHSVFTGLMPFLPPNQQHQSTEGIALKG